MEASIGVNLRVTAHSNQGGRKYMEDMFCVAYQPTSDDRDLLYAYFGIFDGHGGREAALYAKHHLMDHIVQQKNFWSDDDELVLKSIRDGFLSTHYAMWKELEKWPKTPSGLPSTSGTTASIAFVRRGKLYIGHVGDSGIVMGYEDPENGFWRAKPLTKDHKPESPAESTRITEAGGKVIVKSGVPRVVWNRPRIGHKGPVRRSTLIDEIPFLAVARSLGDLWSYNSEQNEFVVSPEPDVSVLEIDVHSHRCLILGTDGLWNMLSPQDAVNSVYFAEKNNERQPQPFQGSSDPSDPLLSKSWINPSKRLVDRALDRWFQHSLRADNTSVVTVVVDPPGPPKRSHVIRHSFSSTQDPNSSPVGISRYFPQNRPPATCGPISANLRDNITPREQVVVASPTAPPAMNPSKSPAVSHPRVIPKPATVDTLSQLVSPVPRPSRAKPTRAICRVTTTRIIRIKRTVADNPLNSKSESLKSSNHSTAVVQSGPGISAFCQISSRTLRETHRYNPPNNENTVNVPTSDDVQIHEISSSSESSRSIDSQHSLRRKRKIQKEVAPKKRQRVDEIEVNRPRTRHAAARNELTALINAIHTSVLNPDKEEIKNRKNNSKKTLKAELANVSDNPRRTRLASQPKCKIEDKKTIISQRKIMKRKVVKKSGSGPLSKSTIISDSERSLRSTSKITGRITRSMGQGKLSK